MEENRKSIVETENFGQVMGDWYLTRRGRLWGLVRGDPKAGIDPSVWWIVRPEHNPCAGMTDEQIDAEPGARARFRRYELVASSFLVQARVILEDAIPLADAARAAGWTPEQGTLSFWLCDRMGRLLAADPRMGDLPPKPRGVSVQLLVRGPLGGGTPGTTAPPHLAAPLDPSDQSV